MNNIYNSETGCCPRFDPAGWDGKEHVWQNKLFITDKVPAICHIPLMMGKVITRCLRKIIAAGAATVAPPIMLCDETSPWKTILHIETAKDIPAAAMTRISGTFVSKVFEGPYKDAPKWYQQMKEFLKSGGKQASKIYAYYTTCPKCAKHYGKNYVILLAQTD